MDCTECEHYEPYKWEEDDPENRKHETMKMRCSMLGGYFRAFITCSYFTPKKPEPERRCKTCDLNSKNCFKIAGQCCDHDKWCPIPKEPEKPKEKPGCATISPEKDAENKRYSDIWDTITYRSIAMAAQLQAQAQREAQHRAQSTETKSNRKERTMLKKTLHLYRMAGMLWLTYGHYIVMAWLTPWLVKAVNLGLCLLPDVEKVVDGEYVMMPIQVCSGIMGVLGAWSIAIIAILAVCAFTWAWSKATKFWYNEK